jgi:hypothetical protein
MTQKKNDNSTKEQSTKNTHKTKDRVKQTPHVDFTCLGGMMEHNKV